MYTIAPTSNGNHKRPIHPKSHGHHQLFEKIRELHSGRNKSIGLDGWDEDDDISLFRQIQPHILIYNDHIQDTTHLHISNILNLNSITIRLCSPNPTWITYCILSIGYFAQL